MAAEIKANYENIPALERLKESLAQPHGASILAMIMLDNRYDGLEMELTFANEILFNIYVKHIITVWQKYDAEPCLIRSHMRNGVWTTEYGAFDNGAQAYQQIASDRAYGNKRNIIEVTECSYGTNLVVRDNAERGNQVVFTILRWNTPKNKILTLNLLRRAL
jgi:hypothetical protein